MNGANVLKIINNVTKRVVMDIYGKNNVKGSKLHTLVRGPFKYYYWHFHTNRSIDPDNFICVGYTSDREEIESIWIIPNEGHICGSLNIKIWKTFKKMSKWDEFEIDPTSYNDAHHSIMKFLGNKIYFGIKDIKNWLNEGG